MAKIKGKRGFRFIKELGGAIRRETVSKTARFLDEHQLLRGRVACIERSEQLGYAEAPINTSFGPLVRKDVRDNQRLLLDDPGLAAAWWERAKGLLVEEWLGWKAVGLNERFRFYRYDPGQRFAPHMDGCFRRDNGEESQFTFLVYLNDGFEGARHRSLRGRRSGRSNHFAKGARLAPLPAGRTPRGGAEHEGHS